MTQVILIGSFSLCGLLLGCTSKAWSTHPMPTPPDQSCRTGGGVGHDVWIWECFENRRVVIFRYCGGFVGCRPAKREETACGDRTPFERSHGEYLAPCRPVPEGQRWRVR